jgi:excisionase family DNA binding protein
MLTDHITAALVRHCQQLRRDGQPIPLELAVLRDAFYAAATASNRQAPPLFDPPQELAQPDAVSIPEAAGKLGVSQRTVERRIADGSLRVVRLGRRVLVPQTEVDRLLGGA